MQPGVSTIVPSCGRPSELAACLRGLASAASAVVPFEVVVVDSSADREGIRRAVHDARAHAGAMRIELLEAPIPTRAGAARNLGARRASGEILAFVDDDCVVAPDWLAALTQAFSAGADAVAGAVSAAQCHSARALALHLVEFSAFLPAGAERTVAFAPACNFALRAEHFWAVGGFPEIPAAEDMALCAKLTQRGTRVRFIPTVVAEHLPTRELWDALGHVRFLATWSTRVRLGSDLEGARMLAHPALLPAAVVVRAARITARSARHVAPAQLGRALPAVGLLLCAWWVGGAAGAQKGPIA